MSLPLPPGRRLTAGRRLTPFNATPEISRPTARWHIGARGAVPRSLPAACRPSFAPFRPAPPEPPGNGPDLRQRAGYNSHRIVAAIAMASVLDALGFLENVDAGAVERRAKRVRMERLTPLSIGFLVAMGAVGGVGESARLDEIAVDCGCISGSSQGTFAELEIVSLVARLRIGIRGYRGGGGGWVLGRKGAQTDERTHDGHPHGQDAASRVDSHFELTASIVHSLTFRAKIRGKTSSKIVNG